MLKPLLLASITDNKNCKIFIYFICISISLMENLPELIKTTFFMYVTNTVKHSLCPSLKPYIYNFHLEYSLLH